MNEVFKETMTDDSEGTHTRWAHVLTRGAHLVFDIVKANQYCEGDPCISYRKVPPPTLHSMGNHSTFQRPLPVRARSMLPWAHSGHWLSTWTEGTTSDARHYRFKNMILADCVPRWLPRYERYK